MNEAATFGHLEEKDVSVGMIDPRIMKPTTVVMIKQTSCPACREQMPRFKEIARSFQHRRGTIFFTVDASIGASILLNYRGIKLTHVPTYLFLHNGESHHESLTLEQINSLLSR
jgi:hypothetical protein